MIRIQKILRERASGLFLLFLAASILIFFSLNSQSAKSYDNPDPTDETFLSDEERISEETMKELGTAVPEVLSVADSPSAETNPPSPETISETTKNAQKENGETAAVDAKNKHYANLRSHLKKYCGKSGSDNRKKCKVYCSETKTNVKKDDQYDDLYEKYCTIETSIIIKGKGGSLIAKYENFHSASFEKITVFDLMKKASKEKKFSLKYENYSFGVFIYEIKGLGSKDDIKNWWKLSVNGKDSSVGAADCKVSDGDKIEWEYTSSSF